MNYTHLGRTGLKVSRLCLGTMNFGDVTDEKTSARILDEALEAGINFIDTADVYGTEQSPDIQQGSGLSEEIIGRWLQQGGRRERIVLATKSISLWDRARTIAGFLRIIFARPARTVCDGLIPTILTSIRCITSIAIRRGKRSGRPWNCLFSRERFFISVAAISRAGTLRLRSQSPRPVISGLVAEQSLYNLTARTIELEVIPACRHFGLG